MIVVPEDREPASPAALADRLRGLGVAWSDYEVRNAQTRLVAVLGGGAKATGQAEAYLQALARRRRPIKSLTAYLAALTDDQLLDSTKPTTTREKGQPGCPGCTAGWLGEDAEGRPRPCPTCRPHVAAA